MNIFEWKPDYSVGNKAMDEQHKRLLELCKKVSDHEQEQGITGFHGVLSELFHYAEIHFRSEELMLNLLDYPALDEQKAEHLAYTEKMLGFLFNASIGKLDIHSVGEYIGKWWIDHILVSDMKYKEHISSLN